MKKHAGFTLIEMMVALTVAGVLVTPLYIITRNMGEQTGARRMEIEAMQRARTAMDMLVRDFARVGLYTSPNTFLDSRFHNRNLEYSSAQLRSAIIHLNRDSDGNDALLLSGNFLGNKTYEAYATGEDTLEFIREVDEDAECLEQFKYPYAYAHIVDKYGKELDAKVETAALVAGGSGGTVCRVVIEWNDTSPLSFKPGETVRVSANQTILYWVEGNTLVRYFVAYAGKNGDASAYSGNDCSLVGVTDIVNVDANIPGAVVTGTRRVVADFVHDFQVWFRPVTYEPDEGAAMHGGMPHSHPVDVLDDQMTGEYRDGYLKAAKWHYIPQVAGDVNVVADNVSCAMLASPPNTPTDIGPERVRSAVVRLTVRTEMPDHGLRNDSIDPNGRLMRYHLAPGPLFAYRLKSLVSEIELPNLATRADLLVR